MVSETKTEVTLFWFRRDLRLHDNTGFQHALSSGYPVLPIFIFDTNILAKLEDTFDRRVDYIHQAVNQLNLDLSKRESCIATFHGTPLEVFGTLLQLYHVKAVYCNRDYEPQAIWRDKQVEELLAGQQIPFHDYKDQVIFEKSEIVKEDRTPYTVYTPYAKKWRATLTQEYYASSDADTHQLLRTGFNRTHSLAEIGFQKTDITFQRPVLDRAIIASYDKYRDFPSLGGTSNLGMALRFGTVSVRHCVDFALQHNDVWLSELIWREFFMQILFHFPNVVEKCFQSKYEQLDWNNDPVAFNRWCEGTTGYPIVDAGMRQLSRTGFMHNRIRMITASFLCKHLLIDWRWGEAWFAKKLNDYDLAANNGNWQWSAGCGCDAAPYFRIFNPDSQTRKFDKDLKYIRTWYPELDTQIIPPIVDHAFARERALKAYGKALQTSAG